MSMIEEAILKLNVRLKEIPFDYAFLGGSVLSLLITDIEADTIRVTKDVDVMMNIRTRKEYHLVDRMLEAIGFVHDTRDEAPICRWIYDGVTVDVLPIREDVLGWKSKWFEEALNESTMVVCKDLPIRVISAPYFVALKLEAFEDRGKKDFFTSTDFEDIICLFNGRDTIVDEIKTCEKLRDGLASKFREYLSYRDMEDAVEGFVQTENESERRKNGIMERFKAVAALSN